jgi:hypothetical protein
MSVNNFNYAVSWSDFAQVSSRPPLEDEDAHIHTRMRLNYQMGGRGRATIISSADIDVLIVSDDSWVVTSQMNAALLKHEQGHYDIQAIIAREFYNKVMALTAPSDNAMQTKIRQLETNLQRTTDRMNERYDTATSHSINTAVQQAWDQKFDTVKQNPNGTANDLT